MNVVDDLRNRGVEDVLIAVVDGLKGFPEAIAAGFPKTTVQTCIVHLIRNSLASRAARTVSSLPQRCGRSYTAASETAAAGALAAFEGGPWGAKYPTIVQSWRRAWEHARIDSRRGWHRLQGRRLRPPPPEMRSRDIEQETSTATNAQFFNLPQHTKIRILPGITL
jgi:transposase-like protein